MKNSKPFPVESWLKNSFLSAEQLTNCRSLLLGDNGEMAVTFIDLQGLGTDLRQEGQTLSNAFLDPVEMERLDSFSFAKRQREWLGGRIAAKQAALHLVSEETPDNTNSYRILRVENDPVGRPYLLSLGHEFSPRRPMGEHFVTLVAKEAAIQEKNRRSTLLPEISISHSSAIAAALAVDRHPCGLDVQKVSAKAISIRERFASSAEQTVLRTATIGQGANEAEAFTLLWAAKESLRKAIACHPLLGFSEVTLCHLQGNPDGGMIAQRSSTRLPSRALPPVFLTLSGGYACAITVNQDTAPSLYC